MTEQRFVDLETKLAHQEHLLLELNSLSEAAPANANADEKPPHY
jgi:uncharacterized coiled-coil protein SlyX